MNSFLVAAGACISGDSSKYWCALEEYQCPVGSNFVSVKKLETTYRNTPAVQCLYEAGSGVPMGQCTLPDDKGLCTGDRSNCAGCFETTGKCFEPSNGACTLEATESKDGKLNFAVFGLCTNPSNPKEGHCLWSRNECPSDYLWVTPTSWMENVSSVDDFCSCDKVLTGACKYGDNFICAVSEDACDGDEYIGAMDLVDGGVDCRLCKSLDLPENALPSPKQPQQNTQKAVSNTIQQQQPQPKEIAHYTVAAGACITGDGDKYWCALDNTECPIGSKYYSAREIAQKFKDTPAIGCIRSADTAPMGKCTLPTDNGLCTGHKSNCGGCFETTDTCYEPNDKTCTLEPTANSASLFGLCVNPENPSIRHCLWSRDECPSDEVWITPDSWMNYMTDPKDYCTCDKVLVGACQYGDDFVCAVSENACGEGGKYIGAKDLYEMGANFDCHLCEALTISNNLSIPPQQQQQQQQQQQNLTPTKAQTVAQTSQMKTAAAGACIAGDNYWCALDKTQCPNGSTFLSARVLLAKYTNTPAIKCLDAAGIIPMGQCTLPTDEGLCTGHKSNCQGCYETDGVCFEEHSNTCKLGASKDNDNSPAVFGLCVDPKNPGNMECLWSRDECPSNDMWVTPRRRLEKYSEINEMCTCEKVSIGACQFGNEYVCAVSEEACDQPSDYIGALRLKEISPSANCRLCSSFLGVQETHPQQQQQIDAPSSQTTNSNNNLKLPNPHDSLGGVDTTSPKSQKKSSRKKSHAALISILSICGVTLLVASAWKIRRMKKNRTREADGDGLQVEPSNGSASENGRFHFT